MTDFMIDDTFSIFLEFIKKNFGEDFRPADF